MNNLLRFEEDYGSKNRPVGLNEVMRIMALLCLQLVIAVTLYNFPIAKSMSSVVPVTGKRVQPLSATSRLQIGGKYAETVKTPASIAHIIEFKLDSYDMEIKVDKEKFDSIQVGNHVQISYKKGGFFSQYELLSASRLK